MNKNIKSFILLNLITCSFLSFGCFNTEKNVNDSTITQPQAQSSEKEIPNTKCVRLSSEEAQKNMSTSKDYLILDVRTREEYAEKHIKNAINFPLDTISSDTAKKIIKNTDQKLFIYCRTGRRSQIASERLALLGYTNVIDFGGINDWKGEVE